MISVCIATYNGEKYIKRQMLSILNQLDTEDEVIVSDDGSTDHTVSILSNLNDKRIKIVEGPHMHSPTKNFENALSYAKGEYIFLSDQDDEWMLNKVEICMNYLTSNYCVISDCRVVDGVGNVLRESFFKINHTRKGELYNLLIKNGYLGCCMAFRREVLNKALPFPSKTPMHDIWIGNVAAYKYNTVFIPNKLINYCRHGNNSSSAAETSHFSIRKKMMIRWDIIKALWHLGK